jgi:hypothetical protein
MAHSTSRKRRPANEKTLAPVRPNVGIEIAYQRKLEKLIDEMAASVSYFVKAAYRANEPEIAQDASPAAEILRTIRGLRKRWLARFDTASKEMADYFATAVSDRSDAALRSILKRSGISVEFRMTRAQNDVLQATIGENVSLIRSIPEQYLTQVEGYVMRSVQTGRDLGQLTKDLQEQFGVTRRRAEFIARSQNNLATASLTRARQAELGITEAVWVHSGGGKHPRKSHLKAGADKQRYDVAKGWYDPEVGKFVLPGELPNCFTGDMTVGLENGVRKLWRAPFNGPMVYIKVGADLLKGTFNHPILTARGWIALGDVNDGDQVVCMSHQGGDVVNNNKDKRVATFSELFEAGRVAFGHVSLDGGGFDFHGHRPNGNVDQIVFGDDGLSSNADAAAFQDVGDLNLAKPNAVSPGPGNGAKRHVIAPLGAGFGDGLSFALNALLAIASEVRAASAAHDAVTDQNVANIRGGMTGGAKPCGDRGGPQPALIHGDDFRGRSVPVSAPVGCDADSSELDTKFVSRKPDRYSRVLQLNSRIYELRSVSDKSIRYFSGHVYTMETDTGFYSVSNAYVQAKNCRCVCRPVVKGFS